MLETTLNTVRTTFRQASRQAAQCATTRSRSRRGPSADSHKLRIPRVRSPRTVDRHSRSSHNCKPTSFSAPSGSLLRPVIPSRLSKCKRASMGCLRCALHFDSHFVRSGSSSRQSSIIARSA